MTKLARQVLEFHRAFDHPVADSPTTPPDERVRFRAAFIVEECLEFLEACFEMTPEKAPTQVTASTLLADVRFFLGSIIKNAPVKVDLPLAVDALADIDYVVEGCRLEFGVNGKPIADEVHRANMTKVGGARTPEGKTMKPPGWTPPDIAGELERQRRGFGALGSVRNYNALKEAARALPPMTPEQQAAQRLDWAYGKLAIDGKASRSGFKILATTTVDDGLGWSEEQFERWAAGREWDAP